MSGEKQEKKEKRVPYISDVPEVFKAEREHNRWCKAARSLMQKPAGTPIPRLKKGVVPEKARQFFDDVMDVETDDARREAIIAYMLYRRCHWPVPPNIFLSDDPKDKIYIAQFDHHYQRPRSPMYHAWRNSEYPVTVCGTRGKILEPHATWPLPLPASRVCAACKKAINQ